MKLWSILLFSLSGVSRSALGAACCGGGFAAPSIIAGDDKAQMTSSYSFTEVVVDSVNSRGVWRQWDRHQEVQTLRFEGAHLISDRWQVGGALPVIQRSHLGQRHAGFGDISGTLAYEAIPDWDYNPYRPKGILFLQITLPTGKSRFESEAGALESRGNGFWAVGAGSLFTKALGKWDAFATFDFHRSFDKRIANERINGTLKPGYGGNLGLGAGFNTVSWRIGSSLTWTYEDPIHLRGVTSFPGAVERYATAALSASYMMKTLWAATVTYSDQTLFGSPINTSLGRTVAVQVQRRWSR